MANNDIIITGLDESHAEKDTDSVLYEVPLILSEEPSIEWTEIFDSEWASEFYSMKRNAWIEGNNLIVHCVPEEIERYHLERLKSIVAKTNATYKIHLAKQIHEEEMDRKKEDEEKERFKNLKNKLNF